MSEALFDQVKTIRAWLDHNTPDQSDIERRLLRVLKISEEVGEAAEAVHGALGANPRKGNSHTWADVEMELCDVTVTTLIALFTINPDAERALMARVQHLVERIAPA